jgi:hypothetical protein
MTDTESEAAAEQSPPTISDFAETHCRTCAAGWTRQGTNGGLIIVCLLDRKPVWPQISDCDRYEPREADAQAEEAPEPAPHEWPSRHFSGQEPD